MTSHRAISNKTKPTTTIPRTEPPNIAIIKEFLSECRAASATRTAVKVAAIIPPKGTAIGANMLCRPNRFRTNKPKEAAINTIMITRYC